MNSGRLAVACMFSTLAVATCMAQTPKMKMTTEIPTEITTPDSVETRLGTLRFYDGFPDKETVDKAYDNLDFLRGVDVFLNTMPGASLYAMRQGFRDVGAVDGTIGIFESLMDSKSLFLTPNTETVYAGTWLDLSKGPVVVESPPNVLGVVDDFWFRYVADLGNAGPDKGKGGKFLFLPPGYKGEAPKGYYVFKSPTFGNLLIWRGFVVNGSTQVAVENFKKSRIYPLADAAQPPKNRFIDISGKSFNTIHANNAKFYEEVNAIVQEEPGESQDVEILGQMAAIGIRKGKPFEPDERMKKILADAAAVGNATARAISFRSRNQESFIYPGKAWFNPFAGGSYLFLSDGARDLDGRTSFFYVATVVTPAMAAKMVGVGSQYAGAALDVHQDYLDGAKTYRLTLPPNVPAKDFWSVVLYDSQTRSELQTDQRFPSLGSQNPNVKQNADGSYDIYFGPHAPAGKESNWVQTVPGKGWFMLLRLYGPLEPWFDKTWRPGDIEPIG
jgi:hypothetical protein